MQTAEEGGAAMGLGLLAEAPSGGTSTVLVAGAVAAATAGITAIVGSGVYLAKTAGSKDTGPSGKSKIHKKRHSSLKKAKDAAARDGSGKPVKHPSPKKGKPHFHPADKNGKKLPGSTHHEYP